MIIPSTLKMLESTKNNCPKIDSFEAIFNWRKTVGMKRGVLFENGADDDTLILEWVIIYESYEVRASTSRPVRFTPVLKIEIIFSYWRFLELYFFRPSNHYIYGVCLNFEMLGGDFYHPFFWYVIFGPIKTVYLANWPAPGRRTKTAWRSTITPLYIQSANEVNNDVMLDRQLCNIYEKS